MLTFTENDEIEAAFKHFRRKGFPYPKLSRHQRIHIFRQLQDCVSEINKQSYSLLGGWKIITREQINDCTLANIFHRHLWESHAAGMRSPLESFAIDKSLETFYYQMSGFGKGVMGPKSEPVLVFEKK